MAGTIGIIMANGLPQGFILDTAQPAAQGLPAGFQLDQPQQGGITDGLRTDIDDRAADIVGDSRTRQVVDPAATVIEPLLTVATGAIAEPIAGLAGIVQGINPFAEPGAATEAVEATREALTFQPRTEEGKRGLQALGSVLQPVGDVLQASEKFLGDSTLEATGSPALAAAAATIPTALLEVLGVAATKGALKTKSNLKEAAKTKEVTRAIVSAAPDIDQLKDVARSVYKELDESGVTLKPKAYSSLVGKVEQAVRKAGFDADLTPKTASVLKRLRSEIGKPQSLTQVDTLRKVAQNAAKSIEPAEAALGSIIVDNIDSFLDASSSSVFTKGTVKAADIGPKYKVARELWGRARRSELINESFEKARNQASGFENGLVTQFRGILNNKKKSRFFKPKELEAMQKVVRGTTTGNIAKVIGRLGFSEGHATNIIGGSLGIAGGAAVGGPIGAVAVPLIGQVSRKLAQRLTKGNAEFADIVVRAGNSAEEIASAYLDNTPRKLRSSEELSQLLSRPDIALDNLIVAKNPLLRDAAEIAKGSQIIAAVSAVPGAIQATQDEQ